MTPYQMLTGGRPNLSKMQKFGSKCYTYKKDKGKLDSRCDQGPFVGYDKNSPAYFVYHPKSEKVQKHRLVKFVSKMNVEKETQTVEAETDENDKWERPINNKVQEGFENPQGPMVRNKNPQQTADEREQEELNESWN